MKTLRWLGAFVIALIIFALTNFCLQVSINYLFVNVNYWIASLITIILIMIGCNKAVQYGIFVLPFFYFKLTSMSFYYFMIVASLMSIIAQSIRTDFHLDNSIPKWVQVLISVFYFLFIYYYRNFIRKISKENYNRTKIGYMPEFDIEKYKNK